jgi:sterol desaturase/sphingolipid hydroxylase (fatty acid hydroxylase superfamily)
MLHSSCEWHGSPVFITPRDHNMHHARGRENANFAAIFTIFDRVFGTLDRTRVPAWMVREQAEKASAKAGAAATAAAAAAAAAKATGKAAAAATKLPKQVATALLRTRSGSRGGRVL